MIYTEYELARLPIQTIEEKLDLIKPHVIELMKHLEKKGLCCPLCFGGLSHVHYPTYNAYEIKCDGCNFRYMGVPWPGDWQYSLKEQFGHLIGEIEYCVSTYSRKLSEKEIEECGFGCLEKGILKCVRREEQIKAKKGVNDGKN